jgi:hypothetical protein
MWTDDKLLSIYNRPSKHAYYRGIRVYTLPYLAAYTYNLLGNVDLTEDRTLRDSFFLGYTIADAAVRASPAQWLPDILIAPEGSYEQTLNFRSSWSMPCDAFLSQVRELSRTRISRLNRTALEVLHKHEPASASPQGRPPNPGESAILARAAALCARLGVPITYPIRISASLGPDVLGLAHDHTIWISVQCFIEGPQRVAGTLLEEQIHLTHGFADCTRSMQNFLIELAMQSAEASLAVESARAAPINDEVPF